MTTRASPLLLASALLVAGAVWLRIHNALHYPADWGFDASFNWQYIVQLTRQWRLPHPATAWATSDPPLFYFAGAAVVRGFRALGAPGLGIAGVPLMAAAAGLGVAAFAGALVRRSGGSPLRVALAVGLILFLPAHIHVSAMVNEETLAALFTAAALFVLARPDRGRGSARQEVGWAAAAGTAAGLAILTKLTGVLVLAAAGATYALDGLRERSAGNAALRIGAVVALALLAGGWYFARNQIVYGYVQPFGLPAHQVMFDMPPGERGWLDFVRVPLSTWTNPQLLDPGLLRSVWGSTYATLWFDAHRYFLPRADPWVTRLGTLTLLLALLPTAAAISGALRGGRRAFRGDPVDTPLLLMTAGSLLGYAIYAFQNPWFAVLKASTLLGLSLPFAYYGSETLERWARGRLGTLVWGVLAGLLVCVIVTTTFGVVFLKTEVSGLPWETLETP